MGGVGFIPSAGGVSNQGVSHGRATFIPRCNQEVGVRGEVSEDVDCLVEAAVGVELGGERGVCYSSYGEGGGGRGDAGVVRGEAFEESDVCMFRVDGAELVV